VINQLGLEIHQPYSKRHFLFIKLYILGKLAFRNKTWRFLINPTKYHIFPISKKHEVVTQRENRFLKPSRVLRKLVINSKIRKIAMDLGCNPNLLVDDGEGWLGIRIIRPGAGDGYFFSKKKWGPGGECLSVWVPIVAFSREYTLKYLPNSQNEEFDSYLPVKSRHHPNERRLKKKFEEISYVSHEMERGQVIVFGPNLVHSEDNFIGEMTRISIEFRFKAN